MENNQKLGLLNKFYNLVRQATHELCEKERDRHSSSFESFCAKQEQEAAELAKGYIGECSQAFRVIMRDLSSHHDERAIQELVQGAERFVVTMNESMTEDTVLNDYFGYNQELLEKIYQVGVRSLEHGNVEEAGKIFSLLILLDPGYSACWVMLGIVYKREKQWEQGLESLEIAIQMDRHNPTPYVHAASCYKELGRRKEAREALSTALKEIVGHPEYAGLEKMARLEQSRL